MLSGRYLRNKVNPFGSLSIQPLYENEKCVRTRYRTGVRDMNCTGKDKYYVLSWSQQKVQGERKCSIAWEQLDGTPSSLSQAKFAVRRAGSGVCCNRVSRRARVRGFPGVAGAEVQRQPRSAAAAALCDETAPHTRLPRAGQGDPRGCHFPSPLQLPLPCMQGVLKLFFFPVSFEIQIFSARPFRVCPLRPSWQRSCQQKLLVAASGMLSV